MRRRQALGRQHFAIRRLGAKYRRGKHLSQPGFGKLVIFLRVGPNTTQPIGIAHHITRFRLRAARHRQQGNGQNAPARHATRSDKRPTESP